MAVGSILYTGIYWGTVAFISAWVGLFFLRRKLLLEPKFSTRYQDVAYDRNRFGAILDWTSNYILIHGKPTLILSGEFHYWRIPDRSRWEVVLRKYKGMGLNCIRIPFHWGYHSPDEGKYHFDGNRDVKYLLDLCKELRIYVIASVGPYIGSDTQAGGIPLWLVAKREVRLRHLQTSFWKKWDPSYFSFSKEWLESILPQLASYQITEDSKGCIIALQLENKLVERQLGFPLALADELKSLSVTSRDCGITVPLISTDLADEGSFACKEIEAGSPGLWEKLFKQPGFNLDFYGITKNIISPPVSSKGKGSTAKKDEAIWESWDPASIFRNIDQMEEKSKAVGALASKTPMAITELQAGWSNSLNSGVSYDEVYSFYGAGLTTILVESALSQGSFLTSIYTPYGGTNWGALGSPETYTSYDYGSCIREYGHISGQYRKLRLSLLFVRSFREQIVNSERDQMPFTTVSEPDIINNCRLMTKFLERHGSMYHKRNQDVELVFFRNLNDKECGVFDVQLNLTDELQQLDGHEPFFMSCQLPFKQSFIGLGNYTTSTGLHLKLSTKPIYARHSFRRDGNDAELWIVQASDSLFSGEMAFEGTVDSRGTLGIDFRVEDQGRITLMTFQEGPGWVALSQGSNEKASLYIVALEASSLDTLYGAFRDTNWDGTQSVHDDTGFLFGWGAYDMEFNADTGILDISYLAQDQNLVLLLPEYEGDEAPPGFQPSQDLIDLPFAFERKLSFPKELAPVELSAQLLDCEMREGVFAEWKWEALELFGGIEPSKSPIDLGSSSGHCAYRCTFTTEPNDGIGLPPATLSLVGRHCYTVFVNGVVIGSNTTLSQNLLRPGTTYGPEFNYRERPVSFNLADNIKYPVAGTSGLNEVVVLVDSLGLNQMQMAFNDARNMRGLNHINLVLHDDFLSSEPVWHICGVDSRTLSNAYNTSGLFDETLILSSVNNDGWLPCTSISESKQVGLTWYRARFRHPLADQPIVVRSPDGDDQEHLTCPLHLSVKGNFVAYIWLNGYLIGRYYGDDSSQDKFYLMDHLLTDDPETDNFVAIAFYPLHPNSNEDFAVKISGYRISLDPMGFSGNTLPGSRGGRDFLLAHLSLPLDTEKVCPSSALFTSLAN